MCDLDSHPLHPVFLRVAEEYDRSILLHKPWSEACHPVQVMLAVVKAELAEVELAVAMGEEEEVITELIHVCNVAAKSVFELSRRKNLQG